MPRPSWKALTELASEAMFSALEQEYGIAQQIAEQVDGYCIDWIDRLPKRSPNVNLALDALMNLGCYFWPQWPEGIHRVVMEYGGIAVAANFIFNNIPHWSIKGYPTDKPDKLVYLVAERTVIASLDSAIFWSQIPMVSGVQLTNWEMANLH
ncbi:MAG: hypothetical protein WCT32_04315 [Patescibacteria group bacterium]|jgi:hypothetical protein